MTRHADVFLLNSSEPQPFLFIAIVNLHDDASDADLHAWTMHGNLSCLLTSRSALTVSSGLLGAQRCHLEPQLRCLLLGRALAIATVHYVCAQQVLLPIAPCSGSLPRQPAADAS